MMLNADIIPFSLLRKDRLETLNVILIGDCCKGSWLLNGILKLVMDSDEIPRHISSLFSQPGCGSGQGTKADWKRCNPAIRATPLVLKNLERYPRHDLIHKNPHSSSARKSTIGILISVLSLLGGEFSSAVFNFDYSSNFKR
jgi:hypothetical protein